MKQKPEGWKELKLFVPPWLNDELKIQYNSFFVSQSETPIKYGARKPGIRNFTVCKLAQALVPEKTLNVYTLEEE